MDGVACYMLNGKAGLKPIPNTVRSLGINQTTPATGPAGSVSDVLFSEDGKQLLASVKGIPPVPGFVASWAVASDGSLSKNFTKTAAATGGALVGASCCVCVSVYLLLLFYLHSHSP